MSEHLDQSPHVGQAAPAGSEALAASMFTMLEGLERSLEQLTGSLRERMQASQQQTLDHLLLYEAALEELKASATDASDSCHTLLSNCRRLTEELRGVDLMAGRVAAVRAAVEQLEAQVEAVVAGEAARRAGGSRQAAGGVT